MKWREGLFTHLTADPAVKALVKDRIYPLRLEEINFERFVTPAITYKRITTQFGRTHSGPDGLPRPRIEITHWGKTSDDVEALGDAVLESLNGFRGDLGGVAPVGYCFADNDVDSYESAPGLHRRMIDFILAVEQREKVSG